MKSLGIAIVLLLMTTHFDCAIAQSSDFELSASKTPEFSPPASFGQITFVIRNNGPDAARGLLNVTAVAPQGEFLTSQPIIYDLQSGPCIRSPIGQPGPGDTFGPRDTPILNSGESITCVFSYQVDSEPYADQVVISWRVLPSNISLFPVRVTDPNPINNIDSLTFVFFQAKEIPTLSELALSLLICAFLILGLWRINNRRNQDNELYG